MPVAPWSRVLAAMLVFASLLVSPQVVAQSSAARAKAAAAQQQLQQTRKRIQALAEEQKQLESQRDNAARQLREADGRVASGQRALARTEQEITALGIRLAQLESERDALDGRLAGQRAELATLLRSAYALGDNAQLKLLLEQDRMDELARVLAYHRYFERDRGARIRALQQELQALASVGEQIRARRGELEAIQQRQRAELGELAARKQQRRQLVSSLDERYRDRKTRLSALGRDEKNTQALLERLKRAMAQAPKPVARPPRATGGGRTTERARTPDPKIPSGPVHLPVNGSVLAGFRGTLPDGHPSQGWLIAGSAGASVQAVRAGRVAYADWLKGYGLLMILDHGSGWMTLYAFNDSLLRNVGDSVEAGEAIATVGSSGGQGRPALYFELRRNGQPQDPRAWLQR